MMILLERVKVSAVIRTRTGRSRGLEVTMKLGQAPHIHTCENLPPAPGTQPGYL